MGISNTIPPSRLIQPGVVANTAARPTSPFEGQAIYQTDTDEVLYYNGTSWSRPWNMPWGLVVYNEVTADDLTITTEEVQITGSSFTAVANRYYKVTYYEPNLASVTATSFVNVRLRLTNISGTQKQNAVIQLPTSGVSNAFVNLQFVGTLTAGATNFVATAQSNVGTAANDRSASAPAFLLVEDIGPA